MSQLAYKSHQRRGMSNSGAHASGAEMKSAEGCGVGDSNPGSKKDMARMHLGEDKPKLPRKR